MRSRCSSRVGGRCNESLLPGDTVCECEVAAEPLQRSQAQPGHCNNRERFLTVPPAALRGFSEQIQFEVKFPLKSSGWEAKLCYSHAAAAGLLFISQQ